MEYKIEIEIDLPRDKLIELFDSTENLYKWQPDLLSFDHLSGEPGQVGAKSKLKYKMGKRDMEMIETITLREFPERFHGTYEAPGVYNRIENEFVALSSHKTQWVMLSEFRFKGFMRVIGWLFPGNFKKETRKMMNNFKSFAEAAAAKSEV